jgi:hypothetical protein
MGRADSIVGPGGPGVQEGSDVDYSAKSIEAVLDDPELALD